MDYLITAGAVDFPPYVEIGRLETEHVLFVRHHERQLYWKLWSDRQISMAYYV